METLKRQGIDLPNGEVVALLRRRYDEDAPAAFLPELDPEFEKLKGRLENPETLEEAVAERLNAYLGSGTTNKIVKVLKSDLKGCKLVELDSRLSMAVIKVSDETAFSLFKKLVSSEEDGIFYNKDLCGMNLVLLKDDENFDIGYAHEKSHVSSDKTSRSFNKITARLSNARGNSDWFRILTLREEIHILDEILAYGTQWREVTEEQRMAYLERMVRYIADDMERALPDCGVVSKHKAKKIAENAILDHFIKEIIDEGNVISPHQISHYAADSARFITAAYERRGGTVLPNNGIVSRHGAIDILKTATSKYFEERFYEGMEAFKPLYKNLPFEKVSRIVRSCESVNELVEWSRHYKEVLDSVTERVC